MKKLARTMANKASQMINAAKTKAAAAAVVVGSTMSASAVAPDATTLVDTVTDAFELAAAAALIFVGFRLVLGIVSKFLAKK